MKQLSLWPCSMLPQSASAASTRSRGRAFRRRQTIPRLTFQLADRESQLFWASPEQSLQDRWYALEDLLLRLSAQVPVRAQLMDGRWKVTLTGIFGRVDDESRSLAAILAHATTFTSRTDGQRGCLAQAVLSEGSDLVVVLTSVASIARWPAGVDLAWQLTALMCRLRSRSAPANKRSASRYATDLRRLPRANCATTRATSSPPSTSSAPAMRSSKANDG